MEKKYVQHHWIKLFMRITMLRLQHSNNIQDLIKNDYNRISKDYDENWTTYIHELSEDMLHHLSIPKDIDAIDLTCGTGFVTGKIAEISQGRVTGVDASPGMLEIARRNHGNTCPFVQSDLMTFLRNQPSNSVGMITCAWGLGYFPPTMVLREISRILRPGGLVGIIDHNRSSNARIVRASLEVLAENPTMLKHLMKTYYLPKSSALAARMRRAHIQVQKSWDGAKTFYEKDAKTTIERLIKTGAAVGGIDLATEPEQREKFYDRLAEIIQKHCGDNHGIPIKYRYLAATGRK